MIRAIESLAESQQQQTILLSRLADYFAPILEEPLDDTAVKEVTNITYSRDAEQVAIAAFTQKVYEQTGHIPTEQEIVDFLDEKLGTGGLRVQ
jgi:hypothetical protein